MNVLIVHAHPEPRSFCAAMKDAAIETLAIAGHSVVVSTAASASTIAAGSLAGRRRSASRLGARPHMFGPDAIHGKIETML